MFVYIHSTFVDLPLVTCSAIAFRMSFALFHDIVFASSFSSWVPSWTWPWCSANVLACVWTPSQWKLKRFHLWCFDLSLVTRGINNHWSILVASRGMCFLDAPDNHDDKQLKSESKHGAVIAGAAGRKEIALWYGQNLDGVIIRPYKYFVWEYQPLQNCFYSRCEVV